MSLERQLGLNRQVGSKRVGREIVPGAKGPVLSGSRDLRQEQLRESAEPLSLDLFGVEIFGPRRRDRWWEGEFYATVADYDPVLAWHCGLAAPLPVKKPAWEEEESVKD